MHSLHETNFDPNNDGGATFSLLVQWFSNIQTPIPTLSTVQELFVRKKMEADLKSNPYSNPYSVFNTLPLDSRIWEVGRSWKKKLARSLSWGLRKYPQKYALPYSDFRTNYVLLEVILTYWFWSLVKNFKNWALQSCFYFVYRSMYSVIHTELKLSFTLFDAFFWKMPWNAQFSKKLLRIKTSRSESLQGIHTP